MVAHRLDAQKTRRRSRAHDMDIDAAPRARTSFATPAALRVNDGTFVVQPLYAASCRAAAARMRRLLGVRKLRRRAHALPQTLPEQTGGCCMASRRTAQLITYLTRLPARHCATRICTFLSLLASRMTLRTSSAARQPNGTYADPVTYGRHGGRSTGATSQALPRARAR